MIDSNKVNFFLSKLNEKSLCVNLRLINSGDARNTLSWRQAAKARYLNKGANTIDEQASWINSRPNNELNFIIQTKKDEAIGTISLTDIDLVNKRAEAGRLLLSEDAEVHGKPYAVEALNHVYFTAFEFLNLNKIYGLVPADNKLMLKFHLYMGLKKEGVLRKHYLRSDEFLDGIYVGLIREEFYELVLKRSLILLGSICD